MPINREMPLLAAPSASFFDVLLIDSLAGPTSILVGSSTFKKVSGLSHAVERAAVKEGGRPERAPGAVPPPLVVSGA